jgi:hypothetical protein
MTDKSTLEKKAREAIQARTLPNHPPTSMWGGPGCGAGCAVCGEPLQRDEIEYELEFADNPDDGRLRTYHVHVKCFTAWERERHNLQAAGHAAAPDDQTRLATRTPSTAHASESHSGVTLLTASLPGPDNEGTITGRECNTYKREPA